MPPRRDDFAKYYKLPQLLEKVIPGIQTFRFFVELTIILLSSRTEKSEIWLDCAIIVGVIVGLADVIFAILIKYFRHTADTRRQIGFLEDVLGIELTDDKTENYYNNSEKSGSTRRLGLNLLENCFFTKNILSEMLLPEFIKATLSLAAYVATILLMLKVKALYSVFEALSIPLRVTDFFALYLYKNEVTNIYEDLWLFLSKTSKVSQKCIKAKVLQSLLAYESAKAFYSISLPSKIFDKNNNAWSDEWKEKLLNLDTAH